MDFSDIVPIVKREIRKAVIPELTDVIVKIILGFEGTIPTEDSIRKRIKEECDVLLGSTASSSASSSASSKQKKKQKQKQKWLTEEEMKAEYSNTEYMCSFVADRGPNKGRFCGCPLTESDSNCGTMDTERNWIPHTPEEEYKSVPSRSGARCKNCWAVGKSGAYRKIGGYDKYYNRKDTAVTETATGNVTEEQVDEFIESTFPPVDPDPEELRRDMIDTQFSDSIVNDIDSLFSNLRIEEAEMLCKEKLIEDPENNKLHRMLVKIEEHKITENVKAVEAEFA